MGNLTCQSCQPPNCDHPKLCHKAIRCYTAHVRDTDGYESKSKGMYLIFHFDDFSPFKLFFNQVFVFKSV